MLILLILLFSAMNKLIIKTAIIIFLCFPLNTFAMDITASWDEVVEDTENNPEEIEGYFLYYGNQSRGSEAKDSSPGIYDERVNAGNTTSYVLSDLDESLSYCFAVTAYDRWGNESEYSTEFTLNAEGARAQTSVSGGCGNIENPSTSDSSAIITIMFLISFLFPFVFLYPRIFRLRNKPYYRLHR